MFLHVIFLSCIHTDIDGSLAPWAWQRSRIEYLSILRPSEGNRPFIIVVLLSLRKSPEGLGKVANPEGAPLFIMFLKLLRGRTLSQSPPAAGKRFRRAGKLPVLIFHRSCRDSRT